MKKFVDAFMELREYRISSFKSHAEYVLHKYLEIWVKKVIKSKSNLDSDAICLIVDDRPNSLLRFSILNTLFMTRMSKKIYLYTTKDSFYKMNQLFSDLKDFVNVIELNISNFDLEKINVSIYNDLFKKPSLHFTYNAIDSFCSTNIFVLYLLHWKHIKLNVNDGYYHFYRYACRQLCSYS